MSADGPKWLAKKAWQDKVDFDEVVRELKLDQYVGGRFLTVARSIYYLEELRRIDPAKPHPILDEVQKSEVYNCPYGKDQLLGHEILRLVISRSPQHGVHPDWQNVVLAIAGDPRVSNLNRMYQKWWSQLAPDLKQKVQGWLSKLDLDLFLKAMKEYTDQSGDRELQRMFPSRKVFMEGLLKSNLVTGTRLYLAPKAEAFLKRNYKPEHLPSYSIVKGVSKSIIHLQLGSVHMIEGSHSCKLWVYRRLHSSAVVFDYALDEVRYEMLTQGLFESMRRKGIDDVYAFTHRPESFKWQRECMYALREFGIKLNPKEVLTPMDYTRYKRLYGVWDEV